jgi:hypothetical protein
MKYEELTAAEALLKFYTDLGWDSKKQYLNPKKIKLSEHDHLRLSKRLISLEPENSVAVNQFLLDKGPGCGYGKVGIGTVHLYNGWVESA